MPERGRVRWAQLKIGVIALTAFIMIYVLVFLLTSRRGIFQHNAALYTYMADASGLAGGTPVRLNGITVGYVDSLHLTDSPDPHRAVRFDMLVQHRYLPDIPVDSTVEIAAANLLGDKFLNITRGTAKQTVQPGATLRSIQGQDIPELMGEMSNVLKSFQGIVGRVDSLLSGVEAGKGNIGLLLKDDELYRRLNAIAAEGQGLLSDIRNSKGTLSKLIYSDEFYNEMRAPLRRIDAMLADLNAGQGTAGLLLKDPALYKEATLTVTQLRSLIEGLNKGQGTAGKLLTNDELSNQLTALVEKLNTTVAKIDAGQGTLGQFVVNPQLYDALTAATRELQGLTKDIRANPKKFLTLRLAIF
ncbi:MAG TPA: MlaD family protein [Bryobacteraceae bacterium]|jgi:phospholipid/cholesterol/gamma-HCH transport system substrate-binding protein|nr:MlaD family protein [Bryobacteraceae bacterium]